MLKIQTVAGVLFTIHFALLGAATGSAMNLIGISRNIAYYKLNNRQRWIPYLFISLFALGSVVTWQGWFSLLPLLGASAGCVAFWQTNPKHIRRLSLVAPPLWFAYNLISHSYPGIIIEVIAITSNFAGMYRFDFKRIKQTIDKTSLV